MPAALSRAVLAGAGLCAAAPPAHWGPCDIGALRTALGRRWGELPQGARLGPGGELLLPHAPPAGGAAAVLPLAAGLPVPDEVPLLGPPAPAAGRGLQLRAAARIAAELGRGGSSPWAAQLACLPPRPRPAPRPPGAGVVDWGALGAAPPAAAEWDWCLATALHAAAELPRPGGGPPPGVVSPLLAAAVQCPPVAGDPALGGAAWAPYGPGLGENETGPLLRLPPPAAAPVVALLMSPEGRLGAASGEQSPLVAALQGQSWAELRRQLGAVERLNPAFPEAWPWVLFGGRPGDTLGTVAADAAPAGVRREGASSLQELPTDEVVSGLAGLLAELVAGTGASGVIEHGAGMALLSALLAPLLRARRIPLTALDAAPPERPHHPCARATFEQTITGSAPPAVWLISWLYPGPGVERALIRGLLGGRIAALVLLSEEGGASQTPGFEQEALAAGIRRVLLRPLSVSAADTELYALGSPSSAAVVSVYLPGGSARLAALPRLLLAFGAKRLHRRPPQWAASGEARTVHQLRRAARFGLLPRVAGTGVDLVRGPAEEVAQAAAHPAAQRGDAWRWRSGWWASCRSPAGEPPLSGGGVGPAACPTADALGGSRRARRG
eukprot:TRINITY_DN5963_c0_g1_i4.p1 TRINITY_DN5963_c0_g1~~TRINITY_DN5963_c0_g1_i4.p1  ORF type:complete len:636 (+),score=165.05 TRINITY_DN5963_c0_g1_i4:73-1908(+)